MPEVGVSHVVIAPGREEAASQRCRPQTVNTKRLGSSGLLHPLLICPPHDKSGGKENAHRPRQQSRERETECRLHRAIPASAALASFFSFFFCLFFRGFLFSTCVAGFYFC
jgi:hypothetical protein